MTVPIRCTVSLIALAVTAPAGAQAMAEADAAEIVVTGQRRSLERAIEVKRDSLGIVDAAAANDIGRLPDRNVAEVVERLPGVGVLYDQGEGRFVSVRGVPSSLNNYTIDGFEIGNPDGLTRALPLDIVSGQLLNRVEVVKAKTADLDAQGIGGTIDLVTQTAFDFDDAFALQASGQIGYQESNGDELPVRGDVSIARRFGADETIGVVLGLSYSDRTFKSDGLFPDDWRPVPQAARGGLPINIKHTDYELNRERIGAAGSLDLRPSDDHRFYVRGLYSRFTEDEYRQRYRLDFAPGNAAALIASGALTIAPGGVTGTSTATERRQDLRLEYKEKSVLSFTAGGASDIGPWSLDYALNRVHNEVIEPNRLWQFRGNPGIVDFDFTDRLYTATPRTELTPAGLQFRQYSEQDEKGEENIWQGRVDIRRDVAFGEASWAKVGAKLRRTDKEFDAENLSFARGANAATRFTLGQFDLAGPSVVVRPEKERPYLNSPTIDPAKISAFTDERLAGPLFVPNAAASAESGALSDFDLTEEVAALYAMANIDFGDVELTPGLRVERTDFDIDGFALAGGTTAVPVGSRNRYTDFVPSLLLRATPSDDVVIRFAYTRSIGRPEYSDLVPGGSIDAQNETASLGNPDLEPYVADALDAGVEYYFARGGLISVGLFGKQIKNPIFRQEELTENIDLAGQTFPRLRISRPLNADEGEILGIEFGYQQQFTFLPGWLSGFGIAANLTLADSRLDVPGRGESRFQGQADTLWGAQLLYQKGPVEASLAYHSTGRFLAVLGSEPFADQYSDPYRRLDAKASIALTDGARLFVEGQNLTDEPTRYSQGDQHDWIIQHERYGRTFHIGATLSF